MIASREEAEEIRRCHGRWASPKFMRALAWLWLMRKFARDRSLQFLEATAPELATGANLDRLLQLAGVDRGER